MPRLADVQRSQSELDALDAVFSEYGSSSSSEEPGRHAHGTQQRGSVNRPPAGQARPRSELGVAPECRPKWPDPADIDWEAFSAPRPSLWARLSDWVPAGIAVLVVVSLWWVLAQQVEVTATRPVTASAGSAQRPQFRRIRDMRVGFKVLSQQLSTYSASSGTFELAESHPAELHPERHRLIRLQFFLDDGTVIDSELLRHVDFIKSQRIAVGMRIPLNLSEQETVGEALILAIEPCPPIEAGVGEVVTGTFSHITDEILELRVTGQAEPIGVTPEHPFWSMDRQAFVPVGELRIGETLRTVHGEQTAVASITPRGPPARVYNLEIDRAHQYHVSSLGLLVHNMCAKLAIPNPNGRKGNALTQAKTAETIGNLEFRGFDIVGKEVKFKAGPLGSGSDRYADVVGRNSRTGQIEIIQIGKTLKGDARVPVIRERRALDDIILSPDISSMKGAILRFVDVNRPGVIQP